MSLEIKENELYKRILEYYIEKYGPPDDEIMQKTLEKIYKYDNIKTSINETYSTNEKRISKDHIDYIHLHVMTTKDYIEDVEKNIQLMKKMNHNIEKLIKRMKP